MKKVLVFQHVPHEILGTLHPLLKQAGFRIRYANFGRHPKLTVDISGYDSLIVLGGPMGVYETDKHPHLTEELRVIREAIERDIPVLGICLGAQLVAAALGAAVAPASQKEVGWYDLRLTPAGTSDPLLGGLGEKETIFQWHGDSFELPRDATLLASTDACANQAFRYGDKVYGFQFHLEVDEALIENWLERSVNQPLLEALGGAKVAQQIRAETPRFVGRQKELSGDVFGRYIDRFSTKRRTIVLKSGHK